MAQNGWTTFVDWSPGISTMTACSGSYPKPVVTSSTNGPIATHWPPPAGTETSTTPATSTPTTGQVAAVACVPKNSR